MANISVEIFKNLKLDLVKEKRSTIFLKFLILSAMEKTKPDLKN